MFEFCNPASIRNGSLAFAIVLLLAALAGCESAEKYQKQPATQAENRPDPVGGELALTGTPAELAWVKNLTEALDAARLKYDLRDTVGAIASADSLARVAETAIDSLAITSKMTEFLAIYIADVYGTLQRWETAIGDQAAVSGISKRYNALAAKLEQRRDSVTAQEP